MKARSLNRVDATPARSARPMPPGTGILIAGGVSLLMWLLIAGIAALF